MPPSGQVRILTVLSNSGSLDALPLGQDANAAILDAAMIEKVSRAAEASGREQDRIRRNLIAVPAQSELATCYLQDMKDQERTLGGLDGQRDAAEKALRQYRDSVGSLIRTF